MKMKTRFKLWLCSWKGGRIALHLWALAIGAGAFSSHLPGILREFKGI
jgi:hypothetical protein